MGNKNVEKHGPDLQPCVSYVSSNLEPHHRLPKRSWQPNCARVWAPSGWDAASVDLIDLASSLFDLRGFYCWKDIYNVSCRYHWNINCTCKLPWIVCVLYNNYKLDNPKVANESCKVCKCAQISSVAIHCHSLAWFKAAKAARVTNNMEIEKTWPQKFQKLQNDTSMLYLVWDTAGNLEILVILTLMAILLVLFFVPLRGMDQLCSNLNATAMFLWTQCLFRFTHPSSNIIQLYIHPT